VATIVRKAWERGLARSAPLLSVKMEEIEAAGMLRAFDVTLRTSPNFPITFASLKSLVALAAYCERQNRRSALFRSSAF
jgi:hypothetical protein